MQRFVPVVIGLVVGILLGAWQPRGEVLSLRAQLDQQKAEKPCRSNATAEVRNLLGGAGRAARKQDPAAPAPTNSPPSPPQDPPDPPEASDPKDLPDTQSMEEMLAVLDARRSQSMAALVEQADLSPDQEQKIQAIFDHMNAELKTSIDQFVKQASSGTEIRRRDLMALGADVLDIAVTADDQIHDILPLETLETLDEEVIDPFAFVSGDAVRSMTQLKDMDFPQ